jgi:hypothetical protein
MAGPFDVTLMSKASASRRGSKSNESGNATAISKIRFVSCTAYLQPGENIHDFECEHKTFPFTPIA